MDLSLPMPRYLILVFLVVLLATPAWAYDVPDYFRHGVTVVHSDDMAPLAFSGLNGDPKGFVVDFWKKWSAETGVPVSFKLMNWKQGLEYVRKNDMAIHGGLYKTPERSKFLSYSGEIFPMDVALFVMKGSEIRSMSDLPGHRVGVLEKGASHEQMQREYPDIRLQPFASIHELIEAFVSHAVDAVVGDYPAIMYMSGTFGVIKDVLPVETLRTEELRAAVGLGRVELLELVTYGLSRVDMDERENILHRWFVVEEKSDHSLLLGALASIAILILGMAGFYFCSRHAGRCKL